MEDFKKQFYGLDSLQAVKAKYRELAKIYHPDTGGSEEGMQALIAAFEWAVVNVYRLAAMKHAEETGCDFDDAGLDGIADILGQIIDLDCRLEIIGTWLYAFEAYSVRAQLKKLGFWFSSKHKAWIYNGGAKRKTRFNPLDTDDLRHKHGCQTVAKPQRAALAG